MYSAVENAVSENRLKRKSLLRRPKTDVKEDLFKEIANVICLKIIAVFEIQPKSLKNALRELMFQ